MDMSKGTAPPDWSRGRNVMVGDMFLGLYQPSPETTEFWAGVARRELLFKHCADCGARHHPRRMLCSRCNSGRLGWVACKGRGKVFSFSEVHRAPSPAFKGSLPYTVGLIETEEGVHWFCRIFAGDRPIVVDAPARLDFRVLETGHLMPVFVTGDDAA
jgi:uncharacterized OB-fold protein